MMTKPKIELYDTVGLGLIIQYNSGVIYSNQTGGTSCNHPEIEGIYSPLRNDYLQEGNCFISPEIKLAEYFEGPKWMGTGATNGLEMDDVNFIQNVLNEADLNCVVVDAERRKKSQEAWVNVNILSDEDNLSPIFSGFTPYPRKAILTWANSD